MKPDTEEWVRCAEEDFAVASALLRSRQKKLSAGICFHVQQCIEKYLKARICEGGVAVPTVHSLTALLKLALPMEPLWSAFESSLPQLYHFAVHVRYPGHLTTRAQASEAMKICRAFRKEARVALGLAAK